MIHTHIQLSPHLQVGTQVLLDIPNCLRVLLISTTEDLPVLAKAEHILHTTGTRQLQSGLD